MCASTSRQTYTMFRRFTFIPSVRHPTGLNQYGEPALIQRLHLASNYLAVNHTSSFYSVELFRETDDEAGQERSMRSALCGWKQNIAQKIKLKKLRVLKRLKKNNIPNRGL